MPRIREIRKRDGSVVPFDPARITAAIRKALSATMEKEVDLAESLGAQVVQHLEERYARGGIPSVEEVQDVVEEYLMKAQLLRTARAYMVYRREHQSLREFKSLMGVRDDLKLPANAIKVLARRYLLRDEKGEIVETPSMMFRRVARAVAAAEKQYDPGADVSAVEQDFYEMMASLEFMPNTPTLMNAGTPLGQLSACFVLPVEDSLESIFTTLKHMALIHQSGGGTGFSFTRLRPRGDMVRTTKGVASGPVSFMKIYDEATNIIKQGGKRRGANMGILNADHPDIVEFVTAKSDPQVLSNFNLSVGVTDDFMDCVRRGRDYPLVNPRTGQVVRQMKARALFDLIVASAWRTGDPGLIFLDEINRRNPTASLGRIDATNPCGEQPLHPYESCNLGSLNVARFVTADGKVDWERLRRRIWSAVRFLDNVIDVNRYPVPEIERMVKANRRIGLGIMGFAEMLVRLGIPYDDERALGMAEKLMRFFFEESHRASERLGRQRGSFPNFARSAWAGRYEAMRNATCNTIAPTGTISIITGATSGIEPMFSVSFVREVMEGTQLLETNPAFEEIARRRGFYSRELLLEIAKRGTVRGLKAVPRDVQRLFVTALEIDPEWHVRIQAAFQKWTDNAVSKTINLPEHATPESVRAAYLLAHRLKCKGITVYRYGSKPSQVLYIGRPVVTAESEYPGGPVCDECVH